MASLQNCTYFPVFRQLPQVEEVDREYYCEHPDGFMLPNRTWCFVAEIIDDSLSQMPVLGHRIHVRDVEGEVRSVLFFPEEGDLDMTRLRKGSTVFIRYAQRCFFSDLMTEAIKVENLNFVHTIDANLDALFYISHVYFAQQGTCANCQQRPSQSGPVCPGCGSASYCSSECLQQNQPHHAGFCGICKELRRVFNIDFERFVQWVPFRQSS